MSGVLQINQLRKLLRHDAETGKLYWRPRVPGDFEGTAARSPEHQCAWWNSRFADQEAFTAACGSGARHGKIFGRLYYAHRIIWALEKGVWPSDEIDHINGDQSDNRLHNLRLVDHQTNMQNKRRYRSNKSGQHGVIFDPRKKRWLAFITVEKKRRQIGSFKTLNAATAARAAAEDGVFHANHGRGGKCLAF